MEWPEGWGSSFSLSFIISWVALSLIAFLEKQIL